MITHMQAAGQRASALLRQEGEPLGLQRRLADWAADPRTTIPQLHTALDEVLKNEPNPDWDISAIKYGYLDLMREIERPMPLSFQQEIEGEWTFGLGDMALSPTMIDHLEAARRFLMREPERSRRVLRLLCAHYLAHAEARELPPRKPAVWARFTYLTSTNPMTKGRISVPLYPVSPEAPAGARALPPQELACWLVATLDARLRLVDGYSHYGPGHRIVLRTAGVLRTARHTVNSSSCWPRSCITASAGARHLPTKPWSGPISRACPTTDRPTLTMERRR